MIVPSDDRHAFVMKSKYMWEMAPDEKFLMRVPARVYATESMFHDISRDHSLNQLLNVATLPGIVSYALAMPDAHEGYGFPIGGVAAFDADDGIISPGGIGYDINCGVRLLISDLDASVVSEHQKELSRSIFHGVPSGVGREGELHLRENELVNVLEKGARWAVERGYGTKGDLDHIESGGCLPASSVEYVSKRACQRGRDQLGTLGAGNHFVEVAVVDKIFDKEVAGSWGVREGLATVMIHTGSRGLGHQVATDYVEKMMGAVRTYGISVPDRELACAPFKSEEGQQYYSAMSAAANFAWANRQVLSELVRRLWEGVFGPRNSHLKLLYDIAHNIAKVEEHMVGGVPKMMVVHRKGATRCFPGQPVLIPGSMGTASYVLIGQEKALSETWGSSCHGAGRCMSRSQAMREVRGEVLQKELESEGIVVEAGSYDSIAEEAPSAYKDVHEVVDVVHRAGLAKKVFRLKPLVVVKG